MKKISQNIVPFLCGSMVALIAIYIALMNNKHPLANNSATSAQVSYSNDVYCVSRVLLKELSTNTDSKYVVLCKDSIGYLNIVPNSDSENAVQFESISSFKDLFLYPGLEDVGYLPREVSVFPTQNPKFVLIKSIYYSGGSYLQAFGIYIENGDTLSRVFKHSYRDLGGRNVVVLPSENTNSFVLKAEFMKAKPLGGGDWYRTTQEFNWNESNKGFEMIQNTTEKIVN